MTTDPISAISNPIIGDNAARATAPPLAGAAEASPSAQGAITPESGKETIAAGLSGRITAAGRDFPAVNTPLIETIRAQLEQGRGQPNSDAIAEKLMELEQLLRGG